MNYIMVIDVETIGLHGPAFCVGYVISSLQSSDVISEGIFAVPPSSVQHDSASGLRWAIENVKLHPSSYNCVSLEDMRERFWRIWEANRHETIMAADVNWPCESNFLSTCVNALPGREWLGPYPLLDIAAFRFGRGYNAMESDRRLENEIPAHNPLMDARQSTRQFFETLTENCREIFLSL